MRRIVAFDNVSADGFFSDLEGSLDWATPDPEVNAYVMGQGAPVDTALFGRVTYEHFEAFWPRAAENASLPADLRAFADSLGAMTKIVYSTTRRGVTWKNSRIEPVLRAADVAQLKRAPGGDIIVFGSGSIVSALADHGLIDEFQFVVNPVYLGQGKSLLATSKKHASLRLLDAKPFASGNLLLRYAPAP